MRLSSVRGCEHQVVTGPDQGHRRNDGFVEIVASRTGAAALHLNASGIGPEHKDCALSRSTRLCHDLPPRLRGDLLASMGRPPSLSGAEHALEGVEHRAEVVRPVVAHVVYEERWRAIHPAAHPGGKVLP